MYADWTSSSHGLPLEGQKIAFVLDCRSVAMEGTYVNQAFHSQWAQYAVDRVRSWRNLSPQREVTPARSQPEGAPSSAPLHGTNHHPLTAGGEAHAA